MTQETMPDVIYADWNNQVSRPWLREDNHGTKYVSADIADKLADALRDIRDNYDHDSDAHKYNTSCRVCTATEALTEYEASK